jgi:hypothetical protein
MILRNVAIAFGLLAGIQLAGQAFADPVIQNYETEGNLKATHNLDCHSIAQIKQDYTPPDLMISFDKCLAAGRYNDALDLFQLAGTYSRFDTLRVTDQTAHDAFQVLMVEHPIEEPSKSIMYGLFKTRSDSSSEEAKFCSNVKLLGPPTYFPAYMIQHGMGAFFGKSANGGIAPNFDVQTAWKTSLDKYLHCDVSEMK